MPANRPRLPYFIPADLDFKQLPDGFRNAVDDIILPAYQELVLEAPTSLERSVGMTFCCNVWLDLLEQFQIRGTLGEMLPQHPPAGMMTSTTQPYGGSFLPDNLSLDRYLRLGARKERMATFLLQFRVARARWGAPIDGPSAARPACHPAHQLMSDSSVVDTSDQPVVREVAENASIESGNNLRLRMPR